MDDVSLDAEHVTFINVLLTLVEQWNYEMFGVNSVLLCAVCPKIPRDFKEGIKIWPNALQYSVQWIL